MTVKERVWNDLELNNRSVIFNVSDSTETYIGSGIIEDAGDLALQDWVYDVGYEISEEEYIEVYDCSSYMIGNGEVEHAGSDDVAYLQLLLDENPQAFDELVADEADCLLCLKELYVDNPYYEEEEDYE